MSARCPGPALAFEMPDDTHLPWLEVWRRDPPAAQVATEIAGSNDAASESAGEPVGKERQDPPSRSPVDSGAEGERA